MDLVVYSVDRLTLEKLQKAAWVILEILHFFWDFICIFFFLIGNSKIQFFICISGKAIFTTLWCQNSGPDFILVIYSIWSISFLLQISFERSENVMLFASMQSDLWLEQSLVEQSFGVFWSIHLRKKDVQPLIFWNKTSWKIFALDFLWSDLLEMFSTL